MIYLYILGILPSLIWLSFYLKKDAHPESNKMIIKIFIYGVISGLWAIILQKTLEKIKVGDIISTFLFGAFVEEYVKYLAVKIGVFRNSELDEPLDLILYMIISGLGFVALENTLILYYRFPSVPIFDTILFTFLRFISATFLHALCSGVFGYFIALSFYHLKKRRIYFLKGILFVSFLHGLYNFSLRYFQNIEKIIIPIIILIMLAI
ncbi:MAG: PrsW family intramembrane metalloprotease, partial [Minisyncoccia bacterium]